MKKTLSRLLALALTAAMVLTGCSSGGDTGSNGETGSEGESSASTSDTSEDAIKDLYIPRLATRELQTFNILYTQRAEDGENLTSLVDGLLESNPKGELVPCIAEEWGSEDGGLTWTFTLPYTVVYTCVTEKPYFDSLASYVALYPMAQGMVDELGGVDEVQAMTNETMWYNGCYTMTSYVQNNEKVFTKNPLYWDTDCTLFDTVTVKLVESNDVAFQLYENNEVDYVQLTESQLTTIARDPSHPLYDYLVPDVPSHFSYQMQFNYNKMNEDGTPDTNWNTAIANENFRKSWWYGLDLSEWWKRQNAIDPMSCENNAFTMKGLVYTSDGKDYTQMVEENLGLPEKNGETMVRLDADQFEQCKAQAIEELTAAGVTFPVTVDYYISASSQTALDSANVLAQTFSDTLGDDYVKLNIKTYVNAINTEVVTPKLQAFVINGWGADYGDPQNYLGQMTYGQDTAYYSMQYNNINDVEENENTKALLDAYKEFTTMVDAANAINDDMDARYTAYAEAEAYMLEHVFVLPCYYQVGWCLTRVDNDTKMQPMFGSVGDKMKNWGSNVNGYTSEEKGVAELVAAYSSEQQ